MDHVWIFTTDVPEDKLQLLTLDFSDLKTEVFLKDVFTFVQLLQSVLVGFIL